MTGKIQRINRNNGFGFIIDSNGDTRFFHSGEAIPSMDALWEGMEVEFQPTPGPKPGKLRAIKVRECSR